MINLFHIPSHIIDTSNHTNLLHGDVVVDLENTIANYVGAKYAVTFNSATSAIFLALLDKDITVTIPSMIPPVVPNAILTSGNKYIFRDDVDWVGDSYILHDFGDYKIIDSAQKLEHNQFINECNDGDLMVFSFYPTKPVGSCDGGMIVSNDLEKINKLKELALNGMTYSNNNWERTIKFAGYKMYMNSMQADIALRNFSKYKDKLSSLKIVRNYYNEAFNLDNTSNHLYRIDVKDRPLFISKMKDVGISCGVHYDATHLHDVYKIDGSNCPLTEVKSLTTVSIPFNEGLTINEISHIIKQIHMYNEIESNKY